MTAESITVSQPTVRRVRSGRNRLEALVDGQPIWMESSESLRGRPEPFLAAMLLPAMALARGIQTPSSVDPSFLASVGRVQDLVHSWWGYQRVEVAAPIASAPASTRSSTSQFFTGGVDSFFSFVRNRESVENLVFVHGFDVPLEDDDRFAKAFEEVGAVAESAGLRAVSVSTNLREHPTFNALGWPRTHGAALVAIALALEALGPRFLIASSDERGRPHGSHKDLDPLWSSALADIVNDGNHRSRLEKTIAIGADHLVQRYLRVCWENRASDLNCGECEKCLRTQVHLAAGGHLSSCETFPPGDLTRRIRRLGPLHPHVRVHWEEAADMIEDPGVVAAIERALAKKRRPRVEAAIDAISRLPGGWRLMASFGLKHE